MPCHLVEDIRRGMLHGALPDPGELLVSSPVTQNLLDKLDIKLPWPAVDRPQGSTVKRGVRKQALKLHEEYNMRQSLDRVNLERIKSKTSSDQVHKET